MSIKILGGLARGFPLATPKSETTRPTSVMIRRKLFDWRQNLAEEIFIDLFAGSGAMGLEALSRGAEKVFLNDSHRIAFQTLKQNNEKFLKSFKLDSSRCAVSNLDALKWLTKELTFNLPETENAIVFIDPPYEQHALYTQVLNALGDLRFAGEVWIEGDRLLGPKPHDLLQVFKSTIKTIEQGDHFVLVGKVI